MATYNVHAGHNPSGKIASGAAGILNESDQNRAVKDLVIAKLRSLGHTVYDCTEDNGTSQADVLNKIVRKCNSHTVDLDISIHFNAGRGDYNGDGQTGGTEVLVYPGGGADTVATNVCNALSAIGLRNRGIKADKGLYFLNSTRAKAILIEVCFVDDLDDARIYTAEKAATAIVLGLTGVDTTPKPIVQPVIPSYREGKKYTLNGNMRVYKGHSTKSGKYKYAQFTSGIKALDADMNNKIEKGGKVKCYGLYSDKKGNIWMLISNKGEYWVKAYYNGNLYIK